MSAAEVAGSAGRGAVRVERCGARSVVTQAYAESPLRLLTPRNHGRGAWVYTSSYGGGLVDGDHIALDVHVGRGGVAFLSTQASTKVYRSPRGSASQTHAHVGQGGLLIVAPDPVVCFAGSRYRQTQRYDVHQDGALVVVDVLLSGRRAAGERWAFLEYRSLIDVRVRGRLVAHDAVALRASDGDLAGRLGRFDVLAVAVVIGESLRAETGRILETAAAQPVARRADRLLAASRLASDGCMIRVAGTSLEHVICTLRELLCFVPARLGDDPWSRKW